MNVDFFLDRVFGVSYTFSGYTHLLHAHFPAHSALIAYFAHSSCVSHTRTAQVVSEWCLLHIYHTSLFRLLPSHVSPIFAVPARLLRHPFSVHNVAVLSRPKNAGHAELCTCIEEFGYLTKSDANTQLKGGSTVLSLFCGARRSPTDAKRSRCRTGRC